MDYMPCGTFSANAVFFSIGVLTYNLYLGFRSAALGSGWERSQVQTVRWRLFQTAGKIVHHGRRVYLKISAAMLDIFSAILGSAARSSCRKEALLQRRRDRLALMIWRTDTLTTNVDSIAARETPRWRQKTPPKPPP